MRELNMNLELYEKSVNESEKPVLVEFWAPWCVYCRRIAPAYDKIAEQYEEKLVAGSDFNVLSYVKEITDDVDDRSWLFQHIQVSGEVNTYIPGVYQLIYYVIDSDGNQSNEALLTVTVE